MNQEIIDSIVFLLKEPVPYAIFTTTIIFALRIVFRAFSGKEDFF